MQTMCARHHVCDARHLMYDVRTESRGVFFLQLSKFNGVGPKTVSCVLLFAMGRPDFPVDTHVW